MILVEEEVDGAIDGSSSCRTRERGRRRHGGWIKILYPKFRIEDDYVLKHM